MLLFQRQLRSLSTAGPALRNAAADLNLKQQDDQTTRKKNKLPHDVKPVIGLEVHAQLNTRSKLFSRGGNTSQASPNSQLDLLDASIPGSLPTLNGSAVRAAILTGLGLNCTIQDVIYFDRKNYFYTDMPAGYQITQYNKPIALGGYIDFIVTTYHRSLIAHSQHYDIVKHLYHEERMDDEEFLPYMKRSHIKQLQLEQDSAKTLHQTTPSSSGGGENVLNDLVDYNRSGSGLIEIVFEPDLTNAHEASSLVRELIMILRALKTCDCELQEGSLRVDANVSIKSIKGELVPLDVANRVELKNLNSLRSLNRGITYEIQRQSLEILAGNKITQESRTYDTKRGKTVVLRAKETAVDYRYVPEPSIPPLKIDSSQVEQIKRQILGNEEFRMKLPHQMREILMSKYKLDLIPIMELIDQPGLAGYFMAIMETSANETGGHVGVEKTNDFIKFDANVVADFLIYSVNNLKHMSQQTMLPLKVDLEDQGGDFLQKLNANKMQQLFKMIFDDEISFAIGYEIMKCMFTGGEGHDAAAKEPREIAEHLGWFQIRDEREIMKLCEEVTRGMKNISKKYAKRGEKQALRMLLAKMNELHDDRVSVKTAIKCFNKLLKPPPPPHEQ